MLPIVAIKLAHAKTAPLIKWYQGKYLWNSPVSLFVGSFLKSELARFGQENTRNGY